MEKLGKILKAQREELGFTVEEMSRKTKISQAQIHEMENGNLEFFKHDISYLPFMVKSYAQSLYINVEDIRDDIEGLVDSFHHTQKIKKVEEKDLIEKSIKEKSQSISRPKRTINVKKQAKKAEFSQLSLIFIVLVILSSLIFIFVTVVLPMIGQDNGNNNNGTIIDLPDNPNDDIDEPSDDPDDPPLESIIAINQISPIEYAIVDFYEDEEVRITMSFNTPTWVRVYMDDQSTDNPQSRIYQPNESIDVITIAKDAHKISFHVGVLRSNEFYVNDEIVELDPSIANVTYGIRIHFIFLGDDS